MDMDHSVVMVATKEQATVALITTNVVVDSVVTEVVMENAVNFVTLVTK